MRRRGDPKVFKSNLRKLTLMWDLTQKEAAQQITESQQVKIPQKWYRKLCTKGLAQVKGSSGQRLDAIAQFFRLPTVNHLWHDDLIYFKLATDVVPPTHAEYTAKLAELLETGEHDYLRGLITDLHACHFKHIESPIFGGSDVSSEIDALSKEELVFDATENDADVESDLD